MGRKRPGKSVRRNKNHAVTNEEEDLTSAPHSFVIPRGTVGKYVQELCHDFRKVMEPFTASNVKSTPKNVLKDFVHIAGLLNVSHMCVFTKTALGPYLKLSRLPRGPTLTFKVDEYVLARDVRSSLRKQVTYEKQFQQHALLILNGFGGEASEAQHIRLMSSMFQNMFPSLNVTKLKLNMIRRCVLVNYDASDESIEFRHYTIKVVPTGVSRPLKKLVVQSKIPNLSRLNQMSDVLTKGSCGFASETSEGEEDEASRVKLPQKVASRGNAANQTSSVRLVELGPRMRLQLIKIEEGLHDGEVLYHKLQTKTEAEIKAIRKARAKRQKEKEQRKKQQELNVKKKEKEKELHKLKSLEGMKKKMKGDDNPDFQGEVAEEEVEDVQDNDEDDDDDDDAEWYRKEVGQEPDADLFDSDRRKRKSSGRSAPHHKFNKKSRMTDAKPGPRGGGGGGGGKRDQRNGHPMGKRKGPGDRKSPKGASLTGPPHKKGFKGRDQQSRSSPSGPKFKVGFKGSSGNTARKSPKQSNKSGQRKKGLKRK